MSYSNRNMGLALLTMSGAMAAETQEPQPKADKEADEALAREIEAQQRREQEQKAELDWLMLRAHAYETKHVQPTWARYRGEPRRRSKRAQRARERGWR